MVGFEPGKSGSTCPLVNRSANCASSVGTIFAIKTERFVMGKQPGSSVGPTPLLARVRDFQSVLDQSGSQTSTVPGLLKRMCLYVTV